MIPPVVTISILTCRACGGTWRDRVSVTGSPDRYDVHRILDQWPHNPDSEPVDADGCPFCLGFPVTALWHEGRPPDEGYVTLPGPIGRVPYPNIVEIECVWVPPPPAFNVVIEWPDGTQRRLDHLTAEQAAPWAAYVLGPWTNKETP